MTVEATGGSHGVSAPSSRVRRRLPMTSGRSLELSRHLIRFVLFGTLAVLGAREIRNTAQTKAAVLSTQKW